MKEVLKINSKVICMHPKNSRGVHVQSTGDKLIQTKICLNCNKALGVK